MKKIGRDRHGSPSSVSQPRNSPKPQTRIPSLENRYQELNDIFKDIDTPGPSIPGSPFSGIGTPLPGAPTSGRDSRQSDFGPDPLKRSTSSGTDNLIERYAFNYRFCINLTTRRVMTPRVIVDLIPFEQELFELPQKVRINLVTEPPC
jgi:hypothetical protein